MSVHEQLLKAIKHRASQGQAKTAFAQGIITADRYVKTVLDCVGSDACYKYAATKQTSFDDVLKKAAQTLVHRNEDMLIEGSPVRASNTADIKQLLTVGDNDIEMPKNTLMVFRHVLTTPRKDRDKDVLRTEGAVPDPKMLMLWQHIHTLPIGKMLLVANHTEKQLSLISAIIDMNELSHDAAVMVDNDMARFSHGFRALEFEQLKAEPHEEDWEVGFDVKRFEIMEESVVSVPSNVDAEVEGVIVGLAESGKLTSGIMKEQAKQIKEKMPVQVSVIEQIGDYSRTIQASSIDALKQAAAVYEKGENSEEQGTGQTPEKGTGCGCGGDGTCPSKQKDGDAQGKNKGTSEAENQEIKSAVQFYSGQVKESWEFYERQLDKKSRDHFRSMDGMDRCFFWRLATFSEYVIFCAESYDCGSDEEFRYYKCGWKVNDSSYVEFTEECEEIDLELSVDKSKEMSPYSILSDGKTKKLKVDIQKETPAKEAIAIVLTKATESQLNDLKSLIQAQQQRQKKTKQKAKLLKMLK